MTQQLCVSARECQITRGRVFAVGDRIMFRCEWWTVVGMYFSPQVETVEKMYVLQSTEETYAEPGRAYARSSHGTREVKV